MKKIALFLALLLSFSLLLSGCSYAAFEDKVKGIFTGGEEKKKDFEGKTAEPESQKMTPGTSNNTFGINKAVLDSNGIEYTVKSAKLYNTLANTGIDRSKIRDESSFTSNGEVNGGKILVVDMLVKNVSCKKTEIYINNLAATTLTSAEGVPVNYQPFYFSNAPAKTDDGWKNYFVYSMPIGSEQTFTLGWAIENNIISSNNFRLRTDGARGTNYPDVKYIDLNLPEVKQAS